MTQNAAYSTVPIISMAHHVLTLVSAPNHQTLHDQQHVLGVCADGPGDSLPPWKAVCAS